MNYLLCWTVLFTFSEAAKKNHTEKVQVRRQLRQGYQTGTGNAPVPSAIASYGSGSPSVNLPGYVANFQAANVPFVAAQNPNVFVALDQLRGRDTLTGPEAQLAIANAYPGSSYPTYSHIPQTSFSCSQVRQFGFYADPETRCQVFRRCEANNYMFSYICPNGTLFNQITLVCDWWYNVNCPNSPNWVDYSNPRIYRQDLRLFDDAYYSSGGGGSSGSSSGYSSGSSGSYGSSAGSSYSQGSSSPMYRSGTTSLAFQLLTEPLPAASQELTLREILTQLPTIKPLTGTTVKIKQP